ncbi:MAG: precorrin-2 C(20)-methyltransferase [Chloroflexaceae bacterium]|nr:precorrin-2 C(20)-methyltransferase [Chloroflexaceae bacterium]
MGNGTFYGISVGPGDPELLTLKGLRLLQQAPVVAFPAGIGNKTGLAQQTVTPWLAPTQHQLSLHFPYVQDKDKLRQAWKVAADKVWQFLKIGKDVVFACEGDVSFYSTFTYLAQTLLQHHPDVLVESVPGVCSPVAAAAALGLPLTVGKQRLAVLPALYCLSDLEQALTWAETIVLLKISSVYSQVWQILQQYQLLERSWVVERVGLPDRVIYRDLHARPQLQLSYFSLLIVQQELPLSRTGLITDG